MNTLTNTTATIGTPTSTECMEYDIKVLMRMADDYLKDAQELVQDAQKFKSVYHNTEKCKFYANEAHERIYQYEMVIASANKRLEFFPVGNCGTRESICWAFVEEKYANWFVRLKERIKDLMM